MANNDLVLRLLHAESNAEMVTALTDAGYWDDPASWRPVGDNESNFATINNQQGDPFSALTEKIVNSVDAVLVGECLRRGIDPTSSSAPRSIREAVARFIENLDGPLREGDGQQELWDERGINRTPIAQRIVVAATGPRVKRNPPPPSISIIDDGEGQCPRRFPDTLMSLQKDNKVKIQFVQGKWNMGGTGVLSFCSEPNHFQLVISKRDPALLPPGAPLSDHNWGYTVVRKRPRRPDERVSVFEYLAPTPGDDGQHHVLECDLSELPLYPTESPDAAFSRKTSHGTLIKLMEYRWDTDGATRSTVLQGKCLYSQIDCCMPTPPLPIRLFEGRDFGSNSSAVTVTGIVSRLRDQAGVVEAECPIGGELMVKGQRLPVLVYVFTESVKGKRDTYMAKYGVLLTVNGQKHGSFPQGFFSTSAVDKSYIRDSMAAVVDCTDISPELRDNLFMASRDRMRLNDFNSQLKKELQDFLKTNEVLRALNNRRRQEQIDRALKDDSPLESVLAKLLRQSPLLAQYFKLGSNVPAPFPGSGGGSGSLSSFLGQPHPSFFRFRKGATTSVTRSVEAGKRARLEFETDAVNDYFTRPQYQGRCSVVDGGGASVSGHWGTLHEGALAYVLAPFESDDVGRVINLTFAVVDAAMGEPLECTAEVTVVPAAPPAPPGGRGERKVPNSGEGDSGAARQLSIPPIHAGSHNNPEHTDWTDQTAMQVFLDGTHADRFVYNRDNRFLKNAQKHSRTDSRLLEQRFKIGLALLSLAYIDDLTGRASAGEAAGGPGDQDGTVNIENEVARFTKAVAPVLLPLVEALADIDVVSLTDVEPDL